MPPVPAWILRKALLASCGPLEHGPQLEVVELLLDACQLGFELGLEAGVFLGQLGAALQVAGVGGEVLDRA